MPTQLQMFDLDQQALERFLGQWLALEEEEDRLRESKRQLKEEYQEELPMRGVLTAVKKVRATRTLEAHAKEPMVREHLAYLEQLVEAQIEAELRAKAAAITEAERL